MGRTGILGGTFDPIHMGHLILAQTALEVLSLDRILLIPTGISYLKTDHKVGSAADRLEMTKLAAEGNPHFAVSDLEIRRGGNTYTADTLEELHRMEPEEEFVFLLGADSLVDIARWQRPETIFALARIAVMTRGGEVPADILEKTEKDLKERFGARIDHLPVRNIDISSTEIRERVRAGKSIRYLVPDAVAAYITRKGLYLES